MQTQNDKMVCAAPAKSLYGKHVFFMRVDPATNLLERSCSSSNLSMILDVQQWIHGLALPLHCLQVALIDQLIGDLLIRRDAALIACNYGIRPVWRILR